MGADEFDEERYVRANPDVAVMVARGLFKSPLEHWQRTGSAEHAAGRRRSGFYEHDLLYDEETYLRQNPDVVGLVRKRAIGTGYEHWMRHGRIEFSRGRRLAPFAANVHGLRPFRVALGDGGTLLVGATDVDPRGSTLHVQHGDDPVELVDASAVSWTGPLRIVDACQREATVRLAVVRARPLAAEGRRPRPLTLSQVSGEVLFVSRDPGLQGFFFGGVADANEFLRAGSAGGEAHWAAALTEFVVSRLHRPPDPREPPTAFYLESLSRRDDGFDAVGWFAPASDVTAELSVWSPETTECGAVQRLERVVRPDVHAQLAPGSTDERLGFHGFLPLALASARGVKRLFFEVRLPNGAARFFESSGQEPVGLCSTDS